MGSSLSSGTNNDELINLLLSYCHIRSKRVETAFRAVDRGDYIAPSHLQAAYRDMSFKVGNIHLSAPCIYSCVMEGLSLKRGLSFLNIGAGTGYLSTIAGLILGDGGTNHGIEMHEDCLIYAQEHLEQFKRKSLDVDVFEFCEPVFQLGNFLNVIPNRRYDRVYCGAACPETHEKFVRQFVKVGGILVMPYKDQLIRSRRTGENTWINVSMLPVSFETLMSPAEGVDRSLIELPCWTPQSLQELCRSSIRRHLRKMVWAENENLVEIRRLSHSSKTDDQILSGWQSEVVIPIARDRLLLHREGIAPLQLAMNSSTQTILEECLLLFVSPETANDSDDTESETEGLFAPSRHVNTIRERLNAQARERANNTWQIERSDDDEEEQEQEQEEVEAEVQAQGENEDTMDFEMGNNDGNTKETQDVTMKDESEGSGNKKKTTNEEKRGGEDRRENEQQSASKTDQSTSCKKKRNASEKSYDSSDDSESSSHGFMNKSTVKSSLHKRPLLRMKMTESNISNSDSSDLFSDDDITERTSRSFLTNSANAANETVSTLFSVMKHFKDQTAKMQSLAGRSRYKSDENRRVNKSKTIKDKKNRKINGESSKISSDEDEYEKASNNVQDYRAGLKRRSERKSMSSGSDASSSFSKKSNISESNNSSENPSSSGNSATLSSKGKSSTSRSERTSNVRKKSNISESTNSSENSTSTVNTATPSSHNESFTSECSFSMSANSSIEDSRSDSDDDTFFSGRDIMNRKNYSHIVKKDIIASCMKKKVLQLPLPPPLRLYINYNREFV